MKTPSSVQSFATAVAAISLATGSVASAAPAASTVNPLVALSVFGTAQSRAALCVASSASASAAAAAAASTGSAQAAPGCVLPVVDAPPPPVVSEVPPPVAAPYAPAYAAAGVNMLPLLISLGAMAAIFYLLDDAILGDDDDRSPD